MIKIQSTNLSERKSGKSKQILTSPRVVRVKITSCPTIINPSFFINRRTLSLPCFPIQKLSSLLGQTGFEPAKNGILRAAP